MRPWLRINEPHPNNSLRFSTLHPAVLACDLMIPCDIFLLLRSAGGNLGFLTVYPAETDKAISLGRANRKRIATELRRYCHLRLLSAHDGRPQRHYAGCKCDKRTPPHWASALLPKANAKRHMLTARRLHMNYYHPMPFRRLWMEFRA